MFTFRWDDVETGRIVEHTTEGGATKWDLFDDFVDFLRGCGYHLECDGTCVLCGEGGDDDEN